MVVYGTGSLVDNHECLQHANAKAATCVLVQCPPVACALWVLGLVYVAGTVPRFSFLRTKSVLSCLSHFWTNVVTRLAIRFLKGIHLFI